MLILAFLVTMCLQDPETSPDLNSVHSATRVKGASLWLFPVEDGSEQVMFSSENTRDLLAGRADLRSLDVKWKKVAGMKDTGGANIADHWHVFAHDHHWLSFSTGKARKSYLLKLDKNLQRKGLWKVADGEEFASRKRGGRGPGGNREPSGMPTNDHFLVAEPEGVAVGHFYPGYGHRVFRFDIQGRLKEKVDVGDGKYRHGNGSSVIPLKSGYLILATETLNPRAQGGILFILTDADWKPLSIRRVIDEEGKNVAMASGIRLSDGYVILAARVIPDASPRGERTQPPAGQKRQMKDDGAIVRYVISPGGKILSREVLLEKGGNRPHTVLKGDLLLTSWDGRGLWLRVDRISR